MPKKHYTPEQIVTKLKLIEVLVGEQTKDSLIKTLKKLDVKI